MLLPQSQNTTKTKASIRRKDYFSHVQKGHGSEDSLVSSTLPFRAMRELSTFCLKAFSLHYFIIVP